MRVAINNPASTKNSGIGCYRLKENSFIETFVAYWHNGDRQKCLPSVILDTGIMHL